jgi:hypothetical protein
MAKRKRMIEIDPEELFRELAELERRARETDRRIAEALKRADEFQRKLRAAAGR